jgi:hypothetical protein
LGADPFKTILNKLFIPVKPILDKVTAIKNMLLNFKWMAIHSRGFYETNNQTGRAIECALKLIDRNFIQAIYFATDTARMLDTATSMIPPKYLYYLNKKLVDDRNGSAIDSFEIRNAMEIALEEWFLIGEAVRRILIIIQFNIYIYIYICYTKNSLKLTYDYFINQNYCSISTSRSTFSTTAIIRGNCSYLPYYLGEKCSADISKYLRNNDKKKPDTEFVLNSLRLEKASSIDPGLSLTYYKAFWESIGKKIVVVKLNKVRFTNVDSLTNFWLKKKTI